MRKDSKHIQEKIRRFFLIRFLIIYLCIQGSCFLNAYGNEPVIAMLELAAGQEKKFVLRGTIPVPPNTYPRPDGKIPFAIKDIDGSLLETQVEIVSRYPNTSQGADVIEVIAQVSPNLSLSSTDRAQYEVVQILSDTSFIKPQASLHSLNQIVKNVPDSVRQFTLNPWSFIIAAQDVYGNFYFADPLKGANASWSRCGPVMSQLKTYSIMGSPIQNETTLPHLFGVHTYISVMQDEEVILIDLRFNNGSDGHNKELDIDDPLGKTYFTGLSLLVPSVWSIVESESNPHTGNPLTLGHYTVYPLVKGNDNGTLNVMPSQGQFHRRIAVAPNQQTSHAKKLLDHSGLAFCRPGKDENSNQKYYSWWNEETARYFPQSHRLPTLNHLGLGNLRQELKDDYLKLKNYLETGTKETAGGLLPGGAYPVKCENLGWAHPYGIPYGGMTGGEEIHFYDGVRTAAAASNYGYRHFQLVHRMATDRMPSALYNINGRPSRLTDWIQVNQTGPYISFVYADSVLNTKSPDPMGYPKPGDGSVQSLHVETVAAQGKKPNYEDLLLSYKNYDYQHFIRYTRSPKVLAWLGNDALAKDDLLMAAENFRMSYHEYPQENDQPHAGSMLSHMVEVNNDPGRGFAFSRGQGWGIDACVAAYAVNPNPEWRSETRAWMRKLVDLVSKGQSSCTGIIQSKAYHKEFQGVYRYRHSAECRIIEHAIRGIRKTVFEGLDGTYTNLIKEISRASYYGLISEMSWWPGEYTPWMAVGLGPSEGKAPTQWCSHNDQLNHIDPNNNLGPGGTPDYSLAHGHSIYHDNFQVASSLAYGYRQTLDEKFLTKGLLHTKDPLPGQTLLDKLEADGTKFIENRAALLALAQELKEQE